MYYLIIFQDIDGKEEFLSVKRYNSYDVAKKFCDALLDMDLASRVIFCHGISESFSDFVKE